MYDIHPTIVNQQHKQVSMGWHWFQFLPLDNGTKTRFVQVECFTGLGVGLFKLMVSVENTRKGFFYFFINEAFYEDETRDQSSYKGFIAMNEPKSQRNSFEIIINCEIDILVSFGAQSILLTCKTKGRAESFAKRAAQLNRADSDKVRGSCY
jgi:hypothetical protein